MDDLRTWRFNAVDNLTASDTIDEVEGFNSSLWMDFSTMLEEDSIASINSVTVSPSTGFTIAGQSIFTTQQHVELPVTDSDIGTYTVIVSITSTQGDVLLGRGIIRVTSLTGT